jgi:RNA 2',3'-cyclic 3'-phosphodiesterase
MIRTFLAIRPADHVIDEVAAMQAKLGDAGADVRWIARDSMHLTIHFLGDVREAELAEIERGLAEGLAAVVPFDLECRGLGVFPNQKRPRVVWVGLDGEGLERLAESVETVLSPLGFPPQERDFTPHITIGRVRSARGSENLVRALKANAESSFGTSRIDFVTLYKSQLRAEGSVYTPLATFTLSAG